MARYAWDEISDEMVRITDPAQQDGEWEHVRTWGTVTVWRSSRGHVAVEVEADSMAVAFSVLGRVPEHREHHGE